MIVPGFLGVCLGFPTTLLGLAVDENDIFALGWFATWIGALLLVPGMVILLLQQILEYLIVVSVQLQEQQRRQERLDIEARQREV